MIRTLPFTLRAMNNLVQHNFAPIAHAGKLCLVQGGLIGAGTVRAPTFERIGVRVDFDRREILHDESCITYLDESGNEGGPIFVVGGLTSDLQAQWDALAIKWTAALAAPPAIPFFKFSNPHRLSAKDHGTKIDALMQH